VDRERGERPRRLPHGTPRRATGGRGGNHGRGLDLGVQKPAVGGRVFAAAKGLIDGGVALPHGDGVFPSDDRIRGAHLAEARRKEIADVRARLEAA